MVITLIVILPNKMKKIKQIYWRRISQSEIRNSAAAESEGGRRKARAGKNSFPPTPFLFARPSVQFGARSAPSVPFKKGSDFVKQTHQYQTFRNFADRFSRAKRDREWKHWLAAHGAARQAQVRSPLRF
ncbi:MAG: hypothetical protein HYV65_01905 [Candidatus Spechtbacteria bacterium]|nr:hypothetical protein [Candidatus Spechtbacteria bacterium]